METDIKRWLELDGEIFLRRIGIREGQTVLDFGCGAGNYVIPAARIVGENGKVYALDKDEGALSRVPSKAEISGLKNIEIMKTEGELEVDLEDASLDVVLLYDVLHSHCFPEADDRRELLNEVYRILEPNGFLSVYPMHRDLDEVKREIESASFYLEMEYFETLISYAGELVQDHILNFRKELP